MADKFKTALVFIKTVIAHSFHLETKEELTLLEKLQRDKQRMVEAKKLREQYIKDMELHAEINLKYQDWLRKEKEREAQEEAERLERIRLHLDNRKQQEKIIYNKDNNHDDN